MNKAKILYIVIGGVAMLLCCIVISIIYAPIFSYCVLITLIMSMAFIATEGWFTHAAAEFENRFWSFQAFFLSCACVFAPDSPFKLSRNIAQLTLAIPVVVTFTYLVHIYDRHLRRIVLNRVPNIIKRMRSTDFNFGSMENRMNAQQKLIMLKDHLETIDQQWISSTIQNIFQLPRVLQIEHSIITILADVTEDQLNFIVTKIQLGRIFYKVKDHKVARRFNRTKLLELLAVTRLKELNVYAKVMLIHAFQVMKLSAHPLSEVYVKNIIFSTKEDDLSELKSLTDSKGDINSMHKLIYDDIKDKNIQADILNYISLQARIQQGHNTIKSRKGKRRSRLAWKKILSDVDDTLVSSAGHYPAGVDVSYPKKAVYPGVLAFYRELDLGVSGDEEWSEALQGNLVFLSARPHVYKDMSEHVTYDKFESLQKKRGLYTSPSLIAGSLTTGSKYILQNDLEPLAETKFRGLSEYFALYPEYSCVFIGDNGQGDVRTAEMALDSAQLKSRLCRVYVHEVLPLQSTHVKRKETKVRNANSSICYFKTYIDAAIDACKHTLIRAAGLRRVVVESIVDFDYITDDEWRKCDQAFIARTTTADVTHVSTSSSASVVPVPDSLSSSASTGSPVSGSSDVFTSGGSRPHSRSVANNRPQMKDKKRKLPSHQLIPEYRQDLGLRDINASIAVANVLLTKHRLPTVPLKKYKCRFKSGAVVRTPYGKAVVVRFRPTDGFYQVLMQWDGTGSTKPVTAYLQSSSMTALPPVIITAGAVTSTIVSIANMPVQISSSSSSTAVFTATTTQPNAATLIDSSSPRASAPASMASRVLGSLNFLGNGAAGGSTLMTLSSPSRRHSPDKGEQSPPPPSYTPGNTTPMKTPTRSPLNTMSSFNDILPPISLPPSLGGEHAQSSSSADAALSDAVASAQTPSKTKDDFEISNIMNMPPNIPPPSPPSLNEEVSAAQLKLQKSPLMNSKALASPMTSHSATIAASASPLTLSSSVSPLTVPIIGSIFNRRPILQSVQATSMQSAAQQGSLVNCILGGRFWTPYGVGEAIDYRSKDDMLVLRVILDVPVVSDSGSSSSCCGNNIVSRKGWYIRATQGQHVEPIAKAAHQTTAQIQSQHAAQQLIAFKEQEDRNNGNRTNFLIFIARNQAVQLTVPSVTCHALAIAAGTSVPLSRMSSITSSQDPAALPVLESVVTHPTNSTDYKNYSDDQITNSTSLVASSDIHCKEKLEQDCRNDSTHAVAAPELNAMLSSTTDLLPSSSISVCVDDTTTHDSIDQSATEQLGSHGSSHSISVSNYNDSFQPLVFNDSLSVSDNSLCSLSPATGELSSVMTVTRPSPLQGPHLYNFVTAAKCDMYSEKQLTTAADATSLVVAALMSELIYKVEAKYNDDIE